MPGCTVADRLPVLRGRALAESVANDCHGGFGVAAVEDRSWSVAVDVPRLVVPSEDLIPGRHDEPLKVAASVLDAPAVLAEVVEHDLEHVHRCAGSGCRRAPACACFSDRTDRVDDHLCPHREAACDDLVCNDIPNRTKWRLPPLRTMAASIASTRTSAAGSSAAR